MEDVNPVRSLKRSLSVVIFCLSICLITHAAPLEPLSQKLARGASKLKKKNVAVMTFPYHDGKFSSGSSIVSERLTTLLVGQKGIKVIERHLIKQLLAEKKLRDTGMIDPEDMKQMGSILDVDAIVTGTLIDLNNGQTEINARLIRADSGEVLSVGSETINRTWDDKPAFPRSPVRTAPAAKSIKEKAVEPEVEPVKDATLTPPASSGKSKKLSNENFAPGRRKYLSNTPPKKKPSYTDYQQQYQRGVENAYDSGYDDGYQDAYRQSLQNSNTKTKSSSYKSNTNTLPPTHLNHPTPLGTVTTEPKKDYYYGR